LPRYYKMHDHWKKFGPPAYIGIASGFGITNNKEKKTGTMEDLARMFGATGGRIGG